ncbi:hypothetical protein [Kangiella shandongensis]|uniref:hypothetical protein n=1 Tax=Kangiella shandongensis TaxID=2763258 RepID=UPI001CBC7558|nr:hypothetical protein [Kangiella shandongensis]
MKILMKTRVWGLLAILVAAFNLQAADSRITQDEAELWAEMFNKSSKKPHKKKLKPHAISGVWVGYYDYHGNSSQPDIAFSMLVKQPNDSQFGIVFLEPNTARDAKHFARVAQALKPKIHDNRTISFIKQYQDGAAPIRYTLNLFKDNTVMYGTWQIGQKASGNAFFIKTSLKELKAIRKSFK